MYDFSKSKVKISSRMTKPEVIEFFSIEGGKVTIEAPAVIIMRMADGRKILRALEECGRVCYKSEGNITKDSALSLVQRFVDIGHFSVLEHESVTVRAICDRGVSHEWVRHRVASYSQESTRYCNYGKRGFEFIYPFFFKKGSDKYKAWKESVAFSSLAYLKLMKMGCNPQEARSVLPNSLKTELVCTMNLREWRHFFFLRCSQAAHSQIRELAVPLLREFQKRIPVIFSDFKIDKKEMTASTKIFT
jgi:thymidylate synthase (FAD)